MSLSEFVARRIRELRTGYGETGLSQEALASKIGVATNTVSRWETGVYKPALEDLDRLARFFGVSVLQFLPEGPQPANEKVEGLLRAAQDLSDSDLDELKRYAEFRRAQAMYRAGKPGRKPKER